jgi:alanine dehydrogenase
MYRIDVATGLRMPPIYIAYLNRLDIEELSITDEEILSAIEVSLVAQGKGDTVIEPHVHLEPGVANGHFNVLRGNDQTTDRPQRRKDRR